MILSFSVILAKASKYIPNEASIFPNHKKQFSFLQQFQNDEPVVEVTTKVGFDPKSPCRKLWEDLWDDGKLTNHVGKLVENHRDGMRSS